MRMAGFWVGGCYVKSCGGYQSHIRTEQKDSDWLHTNRKKGGQSSWVAGVIMPIKGCCGGAGVGRLARLPLWMWVVLIPALLMGSGSACPALCTCSGTTVDCHGLGLKTMPRNIPRNTERL
ncbi:hypothetical protein LDENG_00199360 [Lucifuga dentata]|nr:hypothetical protein LDENG_00199360 [Lucifuga dentata]